MYISIIMSFVCLIGVGDLRDTSQAKLRAGMVYFDDKAFYVVKFNIP